MDTKVKNGKMIYEWIGNDDPIRPEIETIYEYQGRYFSVSQNTHRFGDEKIEEVDLDYLREKAYIDSAGFSDEELASRLKDEYINA